MTYICNECNGTWKKDSNKTQVTPDTGPYKGMPIEYSWGEQPPRESCPHCGSYNIRKK